MRAVFLLRTGQVIVNETKHTNKKPNKGRQDGASTSAPNTIANAHADKRVHAGESLQRVMSGPRSLSERRRPVISFIIQFFRHPSELATICERLQDPRVEIIVHADSHTAEDEEALARAERSHGAVVIRSDNLHEIRGYNIAASRARGQLLVFSQDDRMPPPASEQPSWVERVLAVFRRGWLPRLGALGLHRGGECQRHGL